MKLDADWVILSACNTAAGGAQGAEALSGLARAFFYAQARALLVSHWEVNSDTTVKLITGAMSRLAADKAMGRAEAMRQSMLALIDTGTPQEAHPAFWAPFVVVGEGGITAPVHSDKRKLGEVHPASWATSTTMGKSGAHSNCANAVIRVHSEIMRAGSVSPGVASRGASHGVYGSFRTWGASRRAFFWASCLFATLSDAPSVN